MSTKNRIKRKLKFIEQAKKTENGSSRRSKERKPSEEKAIKSGLHTIKKRIYQKSFFSVEMTKEQKILVIIVQKNSKER